MGIHDTFRFGSHAMVFNAENKVLLLKRTYGNKGWSLPGGAVDPGETIHQALFRECREELGINVIDPVLTGLYYHRSINTHAAIFRCMISEDAEIILSSEHSDFEWVDIAELSESQQIRAQDALDFQGQVFSRAF
ncbi:NUDIX domain-containing protein [Fictibacillus sp. 23RED33]|uniref:NUDIX hydrolase n=1 Tax=Fictibacillus sp. 23RED33 TaxID=2745879 RepID=UPI0018CCEAD5|nr:NUDIX domain-containing protein [Fictibacillus sp. 23RED33]MBH0173474.1 NUDIX domain-containing protein [Fictibacillus sp. 23RED33]